MRIGSRVRVINDIDFYYMIGTIVGDSSTATKEWEWGVDIDTIPLWLQQLGFRDNIFWFNSDELEEV